MQEQGNAEREGKLEERGHAEREVPQECTDCASISGLPYILHRTLFEVHSLLVPKLELEVLPLSGSLPFTTSHHRNAPSYKLPQKKLKNS